MENRLLYSRMTPKINRQEMDYRSLVQPTEEAYSNISKIIKRINDGRQAIVIELLKNGIKPRGKILELGAGSCWLSSSLSKLNDVEQVYALDFSEFLLTKIAPEVMKYIGADEKKIVRVVGDFNQLEFDDSFFDFVFFDATLHHVTDLDNVLAEVRRVLKPEGMLIAIREPVVPIFRPWTKWSFGKHERRYGVTENIYYISQWRRFFEHNGFMVKFIPFLPPKKWLYRLVAKRPFSLLNGWLFAHYIFVATKNFSNIPTYMSCSENPK